jgi:uncharacterized protein YkwD
VKVTRLLRVAACTAAAAAAACAASSVVRDPPGFRLRAPDLGRPLSEVFPARSAPSDPVEKAVLQRINADRRDAGVSPVEWDEGAARVARGFCAAQIRERTRGHYLTDGVPPYARTALAGVFGVQAENSATWLTTAKEFQRSMPDLALAAHRDMLDEKPPADGHRRTILDPEATHVGVGWSERGGSFRLAEEFLTRRLAELTLSRAAQSPTTILVAGRTLSGERLEFVTLAHEPAPHALTREDADARTSYRYPEPHLAYVPEGRKSLRVVGADTDDRVHVQRTGEFWFRFTPPLPGLWTVLVYTSDGRREPRPGGLAVVWLEPEGAPR